MQPLGNEVMLIQKRLADGDGFLTMMLDPADSRNLPAAGRQTPQKTQWAVPPGLRTK